ncbi:OTU domain-containing protein 4 [Symphorus nematophorus]
MDGGGSMQGNEERGAEKLMDDHLKSIGLHRKKIAKDGSCLFRAVAEQVLHCQSLHTEVRAKCVEFLKENRETYEAFIEGDFEEYLFKLQDPQQWVGEVEINALAVMYKRDFVIYQEPGKPAVNITDNNFKDKVRLCFLNGNHYDSVYPISRIKSAAVCQSVLYELLYDSVFKVDRSSLGACQRLPRPSDFLSDDNMAACVSSDESDRDTGEPLWVENGTSTTAPRHSRGRGRGRHLSDRVRRSLNPTLLRNIEYDVWHRSKRAQQKLDYSIAAGMQFTVGDRCQVRIDGRSYSATIKEVPPNNGPVTVYIEELGRRQVPLWSVRPLNDQSSWSTVVNRDKRISNGHGDWEERGRGRGRGKHLAASSSVSQATAPGSSGRVQKQHSWPPQATAEEQGGAKTNRKSVSSVEAAFGLTEEQRLAKEEEERNVALVEIQLRDEHSFPALGPGMQGDGGKKKGGEKRRSQRNKTKSPVEDTRPPSPAGERPKSITPPLAATPAALTPTTTATTTPSSPAPPAAKPPAAPSANSDSSPAWQSLLKAPSPDVNIAAAPTAAPLAAPSISTPTSSCAAPTAKTNAPSYALAAAAPSSSPPPPAAPPANSDSSLAWLSSLKAPSPDVNMAAAAAVAAPSIPTSTCAAPTDKTNTPSPALASSPPASAALSTKPSVMGGAVPSSASLMSHLPPALPAASSPPTPHVLSSSPPAPSSSSTASPPPSSSLPPPTFIAPIAPSPAAAQGFVSRSTPPLSSLPHSPSPPSLSSPPSSSVQNSSSSSLTHRAAPAHEAPPVSAQTPNSQTASQPLHSPASLSHIHPQVSQSHVSVSQTQNLDQTRPSLPSSQIMMPQMQNEAQSSVSQSPVPQSSVSQSPVPQPLVPQSSVSQSSVPQSCPPHPQHHPQSHTEVTSLPQTLIHPSVLQSQSQSEAVQPHLHVHPAQPPHPSQVPHPSLSLSASPTHSQTPGTQNPTEAPPPPAQHAQPNSLPQQSHPPHPSQHPPPHPPSMPGAIPLQQLSQLYQDLLYPGFPQGDKGDVAPPPPMSSSKSGDDLPRDVNILRFFFNLGVKAYSVPYFPPYMYLLPLQQAHTMHPKLPSRSPSPTPAPAAPAPHYPPSNPPTRHHQEAYPHPQYPPTSASLPPQYDHPAPLTEPPHPTDPSFGQAGYPVAQPPPHRVPWQEPQMPPPRHTGFPVRYPAQSPAYPLPPQLSQGYHPGQGPGHQLYPPSMSPYPPTSLGYQTSSAHEEHQVGQGVMEQRQPTNGDMMRGQGPGRVPGPAGAAANLANANNNRTTVTPGFAFKKEKGDSLSGTVLLLDPPLNNNPILVPNPAVKDAPISMATMKTSSILSYDIISKTTVSGDNNPSSRGYRGHQKPLHPTNPYNVTLGAPESSQVGFLSNVAMEAPLSIGCSTEDDWEEPMGFKPPTSNYRGQRRNRGGGGGGRGRGGHEPGRGGPRRRHGGEPGAGYGQYSSSHRGRGRERGGY